MSLDRTRPLLLPLALMLAFELWARLTHLQSNSLAPPSAILAALREADDDARRSIIAMSGFLPEEPVARLKEAGYDGHCRRPCPVWQMTDLLDEFFACHAVR